MAGLAVGMVCIKIKGREAGRKVVILEFDKKKGRALIEGQFVRKRKCNVMHLLPTGEKVDPEKLEFKKPAKKEKKAGAQEQGKEKPAEKKGKK